MSSSITVEQYTEKSIVVRGNTIPYKNKLLSLGGKWNKMLRGGEGWIFPLTKKSTVEQALSDPSSIAQGENSTYGNETSYDKPQSSTTEPKKRTPTFISSPNSSEIVLSKKEYLHLISRVEKTEQLILRVERLEKLLNVNDKPLDTHINQSNLKKSKLPLLSNINENDLADYEPELNSEEEDEEDNRKVQPLLRKKKTMN
jgi:hypothetical protein